MVALRNENDDDGDGNEYNDEDNDNDNDNDDDDDDDDDAEHDNERARVSSNDDRPSRRAMSRGDGTFLRRWCSFESEKRSPARESTQKRVARSRGAEKKKRETKRGGKSGRTVVCDKREMRGKKKVLAGTARTRPIR